MIMIILGNQNSVNSFDDQVPVIDKILICLDVIKLRKSSIFMTYWKLYSVSYEINCDMMNDTSPAKRSLTYSLNDGLIPDDFITCFCAYIHMQRWCFCDAD